ncbi:hypothetical protein ScPMuIL_003825 [Solemya velum]
MESNVCAVVFQFSPLRAEVFYDEQTICQTGSSTAIYFSTTPADFTIFCHWSGFYGGALRKRDWRNRYQSLSVLFTCASTCAIQLELVPDLTEKSFILAFRRFVSRRSLPRTMISDNCSTYKSASVENIAPLQFNKSTGITGQLQSRMEIYSEQSPLVRQLVGEINLIDKGVNQVLGRSHVDYDTLSTIITEIEAILNDRPLTYISTDSRDVEPLTPSDLLYGRRLIYNIAKNLASELNIAIMEDADSQKKHRKKQAGTKAGRKKSKDKHEQELTPQQRNPKAFSIQHARKTAKLVQRAQDIKTKKQHIPIVDRTPVEPPPVVVAIVGPPKVGKTMLLQCLVKNYCKQRLSNVQGPVTVVAGKHRRLTLIECNNDINSMIDTAKVADLVLLLVDASFGFEMETFEFLNICQVHGFPKIMGVLTHLDSFRDNKKMRKMKKRLKHRFWTEVYQGAKLFYLSGTVNGEYQKTEVHNLCRFISVMKFRPLQWRITHPYILVDRVEDISDPEGVRQNVKCDRRVSMYGYVRGTHMKNRINIHIPGCGDFPMQDIQFLSDPCPTPNREKKRSLNEKERTIYAPMSGVGGIVYDKDAVYIDLGGSHSHTELTEESRPANKLVSSLIAIQKPVDERMTTSDFSVFSKAAQATAIGTEIACSPVGSEEVESDGRRRRRAVFSNADEVRCFTPQTSSEDESEDEKLPDISDNEAGPSRLSPPVSDTPILSGRGKTEDSQLQCSSGTTTEASPSFTQIKNKQLNDGDEAVDESSIRVSGNDSKQSNDKEKIIFDESSDSSASGESDSDMELNNKEVMSPKPCLSRDGKDSKKTEEIGSEDSDFSDSSESEDDFETTLSNNDTKGARDRQEKPEIKPREMNMSEDESSSSDEEDSDDIEDHIHGEDGSMDRTEHDKEMDDGDEEEGTQWKSNLMEIAAATFRRIQSERVNYRKLVYGQVNEDDEGDDDVDDELGGLFKVLKKKSEKSTSGKLSDNMVDCSKLILDKQVQLQDWDSEEIQKTIKDCFVTGEWAKSEDAASRLQQDDEMYGDFEDLETGEKFTADVEDNSSSDGDEEDDENKKKEDEQSVVKKRKADMTAMERREEKKRKLKETFDKEYDLKDDAEFYENWKSEAEQQAKMNREEFENLEDDLRVQFEGFRPGMYVRVEVRDMPCEFVTHFDPTYPVVLGGLLSMENNVGYVQTRLKKHRWHKRILKTRNPLIVSMGWRRFQTLPLFTIQDHNLRNRLLKYTPEHLHCNASFWGPLTPQGTGILAVESVSEVQADFRIAATGVVLELDKSMQIVKKLKLTGTPNKIFKKTAFIQGMFTTSLEVTKFEGANSHLDQTKSVNDLH